jgi:nitronate monooxygenase
LIKELNLNTTLPVISAGVSTKSDLDKMLSYGAIGVSVGSLL